MNSRKFHLVLCGLAAVPIALAAPHARAQDLLIGQVSSHTSPAVAANAKGLHTGITAYFDYVNANGGVGGRKVRLVNKDDHFVPAQMVELTKEFAADKNIIALAGYQNTAGISQVSKLNLPGILGIAMIAPFQGDRSIVGATNFFPFRSGYPDEVRALVKEAKFTEKKKVVLIYQNMTFGPPMAKLARELAIEQGLNIIDAVATQSLSGDVSTVAGTVADAAKYNPDAIIVLVGGNFVPEVLKQIKKSPSLDGTQIYLPSIVPAQEVVKTVGEAKARGIVISQVVPYPFSATLRLVAEYQKLMKQYAPSEPLSFASLDGFVVGKITVEALKRAGPKPTREKVLKALNNMGELDLGGVYVNYTPKERKGWGGVDLTVIGPSGKLLR